MHEEAANFYKMWADTYMLTSILLGTAGGGLNIILGFVDSQAFMFAQIGLGMVDLTSITIITISNKLKLKELLMKYQEYSSRFDNLQRVIQAALVLLRMDDSSYASREDFLK